MNDFTGMVAIVTGGASGIGAATVSTLLGRGATVASLDRSYTAVEHKAFLTVPCDVADPESAAAAVATVVDTLGHIDILVNNAGIGAVGDAVDDEEWARALSVDVTAIARITRAAMPYLRQSAKAVIVNTCFVVADVGAPQQALYAASNGAVQALTLAMAADHVDHGIRVNGVLPGTADTRWTERFPGQAPDAAQAADLNARRPMGRLITGTEVAHAIAYLCSPLSGSTTGTMLAVDGEAA
jgi:2-keto-3-deoxy-L-fuconate dehydrogenase